ncbi:MULTISPECIES: methionyl-tRNA formyltransferase [unclassified Hydrotalea]|uniref:methionyl-tRNA formyltransferase n=1 Tax=unclassified Hydrotalea TaxID=2643788 RepID=UPI00094304B6|nr:MULTISPECIES: methionyl-tRNA formyltransferase [unclassified Hydrotalea]GHU78265.1 methionyl-tRNA formyltransferase [Spirochaetia bacterium]
MQVSDIRIIFMGTPDFAVAALDSLVQAGCNIVAVVTAPDKPAGRGMQLQQSAVKQYAVTHGLSVLQPEKLKHPDFIATLQSLQPQLQVVVAFRMLPEVVWSLPPMGTINLHGSLLPQYRGAAPINWAIINGEKETGVTTFKLQHAIDTGNILLQQSMPIFPEETAGELHDRMKIIGAELLVTTLQQLAAGTLTEQPQIVSANDTTLSIKHAPKIFTETCQVDWHKPADNIHNLIRGLSPYPGAFTFLKGKKLKIYRCTVEPMQTAAIPGSIYTDGKTFLKMAALDGWVLLSDLQLEGKKRMDTATFLRGYHHLLHME